MLELARNEIKGIYSFLKRYYPEIVVFCLATLFLTLDEYHPLSPQWLSSLVYFAVLPLLTILIVLRKNPLDFGFRLGNWKIWGFHVLLSIVIAVPVLYLSSRFASLEGYYTIEEFDLLIYSLETIAYMFAWEFLYRGFLLFGLKERTGRDKHTCPDGSLRSPAFRKAGVRNHKHYSCWYLSRLCSLPGQFVLAGIYNSCCY